MNQLLEQIKQIREESPQKFMLYVVLLVVVVPGMLFYVKNAGNKQRGANPNEPAATVSAPAPTPAPAPVPASGSAPAAVPAADGAAGAVAPPDAAQAAAAAALSADAVIPPEVQTLVAEFLALAPEVQQKYLTDSAVVSGEEVAAAEASLVREGVKPDPFRPEVGPGSNVMVQGRPSLLPQVAAEVEAAREAGVDVPPVLSYRKAEPEPEMGAETGGQVAGLPEGLPQLPEMGGFDFPPMEVHGTPPSQEPPPKPAYPYKPRGIVIDADPVVIMTNDRGQSLYARVGTVLEPGVEVVAIKKDFIRLKTPDGIEEMPLVSEDSAPPVAQSANPGAPPPPLATPVGAGR